MHFVHKSKLIPEKMSFFVGKQLKKMKLEFTCETQETEEGKKTRKSKCNLIVKIAVFVFVFFVFFVFVFSIRAFFHGH